MELECGDPDRAAELRKYHLQERIEVVLPASFGALPTDIDVDSPFAGVLTMVRAIPNDSLMDKLCKCFANVLWSLVLPLCVGMMDFQLLSIYFHELCQVPSFGQQ